MRNNQIVHPDNLDLSDVDATVVLPGWECGLASTSELFGREASERLFSKRAVSRDEHMIIYLTYENPWGKSGGIEAVARMLPNELSKAGENVVRLSPLHSKLATVPDLSQVPSRRCTVNLESNGGGIDVTIYCLQDTKGETWHLFHTEQFFNADGGKDSNDPYVYSDEDKIDRDGPASKLLRDSLFASRAVPEILREICKGSKASKNLVIHAQDWEFASAVLTIKEALLENKLDRASVLLTLHNPFDHSLPDQIFSRITKHWDSSLWRPFDRLLFGVGETFIKDLDKGTFTQDFQREFQKNNILISPRNQIAITIEERGKQWRVIDSRRNRCYSIRKENAELSVFLRNERETVLSRMIPLADAPISTVSRHFAQELRGDPLQTGHFAGHYQEMLAEKGIIGIDNGLFEKAKPIDPKFQLAVEQAKHKSPNQILKLKRAARRDLLEKLKRYLQNQKKRVFGTLDGGGARPLTDLPDNVPIYLMIGRLDPGQKGFDVLSRVIEDIDADEGRFIISPLSPFVADPEFKKYLDDLKDVAERRRGMVVVAPFRLDPEVFLALRAGITWSVWPSLYEPFGGVTEFYIHGSPVIARATGGLVQQVVDYDVDPENATGILYRESGSESHDWQEEEHRKIQRAENPKDRMTSSLYFRQVEALKAAISQGKQIFQDDEVYGRILSNLPGMHQRLSWERSVFEYLKWYEKACC